MVRFLLALVGVVIVGVVVAIAFGADALWVYGFIAAIVVGTALMAGVGGGLIQEWARRHVERR